MTIIDYIFDMVILCFIICIIQYEDVHHFPQTHPKSVGYLNTTKAIEQ